MTKSPQFFLLASAALFAATAAQQPAQGADVAHAPQLAQTAPQSEKTTEHGRKRGPDADKNKPAQKPNAKQHGKPGHAEQKAEQKHAKPATKSEKPQAKPAAAAREEPRHARPLQQNKQPDKNRNQPAAAQNKAPTTDQVGNKHKNAEQAKPEQRDAQQPKRSAPKAAQQPAIGNSPTSTATPPPPTKPRNASAFIRRQGDKPNQGLNQVRRIRQETREGNRVVIREGDRTIERENNRSIIRHSESNRFAVGARHINVEHHNDQTTTVVIRPNGVRIISTTDRYGHLIRLVRRDPHGQQIVIIDNSRLAPRRRDDMFVDVPPPRIHDRDRYIVEADRADRNRIYAVFTAPPIMRLQRLYTVDQVRYSYPLREYMSRVDLDIHFDTGSWQLTPDQIDRLGEIAAALNEAIDRNPREMYLIEGHTDAVGSWDDNLSLSDRRAEAIAVALTEQFHVPPENLVTQGYGEEHLKVQTQGPSRANRRVSVRRITPLIAQAEIRDRR